MIQIRRARLLVANSLLNEVQSFLPEGHHVISVGPRDPYLDTTDFIIGGPSLPSASDPARLPRVVVWVIEHFETGQRTFEFREVAA
jgi:hypothetical protein